MKELRFDAGDGAWRRFRPRTHRHLLIAADKSGVSQKRFYKALIATADKRYQAHLDRLGTATKETK